MDWTEMLDVALKAILIPLLPLLGLWLRTWVTTQIESAKAKNEREYFNYHLDKVNELIYTIVTDVEQTYVRVLEEEDLFNKEAQLDALNLAKEKIATQLTVQAREVLEKTYVDYEAYIQSKIEEIVEGL